MRSQDIRRGIRCGGAGAPDDEDFVIDRDELNAKLKPDCERMNRDYIQLGQSGYCFCGFHPGLPTLEEWLRESDKRLEALRLAAVERAQAAR